MIKRRPRREPSKRMKETPLQDISEHCFNCTVMDIDPNNPDELAAARELCTECKHGNVGIYKHDAIYTAKQLMKKVKELTLELDEKEKLLDEKDKHLDVFKGKGKTATFARRYGETVDNLRAEGRSQREIAEIIGKSPTTVNHYLQSLKKYNK